MIALPNRIKIKLELFKAKLTNNVFIATKQPANTGDMIYIISGESQASQIAPFGNKYIGKYFTVVDRCNSAFHYPGVLIHIKGVNWMLYDDQYLTLKHSKIERK